MKVLLIDPPGCQRYGINLGLAYLSGILYKAKIETQVLDMNSNSYSKDELEEIVEDYSPEIIGISVKTATANAAANSIRLLKKNFPSIIYVAGGPHITICGEEFLEQNKEIDYGIKYEAEDSFLEFCSSVENRDSIPGVISRNNGNIIVNRYKINLDTPRIFPRFQDFRDLNFGDFRYPLLTSRGCPNNCSYCCVGIISGKRWRGRLPEDAIEELIQAKIKYGVNKFEILDDNFTHDLKRAKEFCHLLIKNKLRMEWYCHNGIRADKIDSELIELMRRSGCKSIAIGIESGDERVFNNIGKGEKLLDIVKAVTIIKQGRLDCVGYFIIGLPGDSMESTKKTVRFQRKLGLTSHIYNLLVPYPGTKIREYVEKNGKILRDIKETVHFGDGAQISFETNQLSKKDIEQCYFLATEQDWICGEGDLKKIKNEYDKRHGNQPKRILCFIEFQRKTLSQYLKKYLPIEFPKARIIEIKIGNKPINFCTKPILNGFICFDDLFNMAAEDFEIIIEHRLQKIYAQKTLEVREGFVTGETLPPIKTWDCIGNKYYATNLRFYTADIESPSNGVIYKDSIPLPFSPYPQWEKFSCAKIQGGLVFISRSAHDVNSSYSADYLAIKEDARSVELSITDNSYPKIFKEKSLSLLERLTQESDITFFPESLRSFSVLVSTSKLNICYFNPQAKNNCLRYKIAEEMPTGITVIITRKITKLFYFSDYLIRKRIKVSFDIFRKALEVISLWLQIFLIVPILEFRGCFSNFLNKKR